VSFDVLRAADGRAVFGLARCDEGLCSEDKVTAALFPDGARREAAGDGWSRWPGGDLCPPHANRLARARTPRGGGNPAGAQGARKAAVRIGEEPEP
jgi:hypothetical protein